MEIQDLKSPLFSIITPTRNRPDATARCIMSVKSQDVDSEHIVIDDASVDNTADVINSLYYPGLIVLRNKIRCERVISIQRGLNMCTGQWIIVLGSDDIIMPGALKFWLEKFKEFPEDLCFHSGWRVIAKDGATTDKIPSYIPSRDMVRSGLVAAGSFTFHRSLLNRFPPYPHVYDCYAFADQAGILGYSRYNRTLGNPWGDDFYLFYYVTRLVNSRRIEGLVMGTYRR